MNNYWLWQYLREKYLWYNFQVIYVYLIYISSFWRSQLISRMIKFTRCTLFFIDVKNSVLCYSWIFRHRHVLNFFLDGFYKLFVFYVLLFSNFLFDESCYLIFLHFNLPSLNPLFLFVFACFVFLFVLFFWILW